VILENEWFPETQFDYPASESLRGYLSLYPFVLCPVTGNLHWTINTNDHHGVLHKHGIILHQIFLASRGTTMIRKKRMS